MTKVNLEEKNSRQLLLWGPHGQEAVCNARVVVLGSDCVAGEFLKNIALHGFGHVTVVDNVNVTQEDLLSNFLVDQSHLGKSRAETVAEFLRELNPDIEIVGIDRSPEDLSFASVEPYPNFIITSGNLKPSYLASINKICRKNKICQAHIQTAGFFGSFYLDGGLHHIFEGSNTAKYPLEELRVPNPFPELLEYFNSFDFDKCTDNEHANIPSLAVFHHAREVVAKDLNKDPKLISSADILKQIGKLRRINLINGEISAEVGFSEAETNVYNFLYPRVPTAAREIFQISDQIGEVDEPFWHLVRATQRFFKKHGVIPHYGGCPDLETSTSNFLQIKQIYTKKAQNDWNEIKEDLKQQNVTVDDDTFSRFSRNVWKIGAVSYSTIPELLDLKPSAQFEIDPKDKNISMIQAIFTAARNFLEKNGRIPGNSAEDRTALLAEIKECGTQFDEAELTKYVQEFCHYKGQPIPSVAATFSAILAEEVTKLIIKQATPVKGLFIYNAIQNYAQARW